MWKEIFAKRGRYDKLNNNDNNNSNNIEKNSQDLTHVGLHLIKYYGRSYSCKV